MTTPVMLGEETLGELTMGVIGSSLKENELRAAIHPEHVARLSEDSRKRCYFEHGYGERFGMDDKHLAALVGGLRTREALFSECDIMLLPKPTEADFASFREGQTIWGWPHCVQGTALTQVAIDRRLTMLAWEAMHLWNGDQWELHVFHINNEMAGYCSVAHMLQIAGLSGYYGRRRRACVISFGSTGRGAVHALQGMGFDDVTVFTQRPGHAIRAPIPGVRHWVYEREAGSPDGVKIVLDEHRSMPMAQAVGHFDVIVNCILQDTDQPLMFLRSDELDQLRKGSLIIDVSCDEGMGFEFGRPTSFEKPCFTLDGGRVTYYAVDHTPSYLWNAATWEISSALLPFVDTVLAGPEAWALDPTLARCIEIDAGVVQNPKILSFQNREATYPHAPVKAG